MTNQPDQQPPPDGWPTATHLAIISTLITEQLAAIRAEMDTLRAFDAKVQQLIDLYAAQEPETQAIRAFVRRQIERERQQATETAAREARADARVARFEDAFARIELFTNKVQPYLLALIGIAASTGAATIGAIPKVFFWPLIVVIIVVPSLISSLRRTRLSPQSGGPPAPPPSPPTTPPTTTTTTIADTKKE